MKNACACLTLDLRLTDGLGPLTNANAQHFVGKYLVFQVQSEFLGLGLFCCCKSNFPATFKPQTRFSQNMFI